MYMTPTQHEKNEWSRLAQHAYAFNHNPVGHTYSVAASLPHDGTLAIGYFDALQTGYRDWLVHGSLLLAQDAVAYHHAAVIRSVLA